MIKTLKEKWVKALRSGRYKQTTNVLCRLDGNGHVAGYCCLGVLCEVASKIPNYGVKRVRTKKAAGGRASFTYKKDSCAVSLPGNFTSRIRLEDQHLSELMRMNDKQGKSFNEIADHIEKNL